MSLSHRSGSRSESHSDPSPGRIQTRIRTWTLIRMHGTLSAVAERLVSVPVCHVSSMVLIAAFKVRLKRLI